MKIAFVTNIRSPYRKLQFEEFSKITNTMFTVYYTNKDFIGRKWKVDVINGIKEVYLKGINIFGYILNNGLLDIVRKNDLIVLGGYEQPSYIIISLLCRIYKKPYVLLHDGVSPYKINSKENLLKYRIKKMVISKASAIFGNGKVSNLYFSEKFKYTIDKIYNQFLTVDVEKIFKISENGFEYRKKLRKMYNIKENDKVIIYSGRLIKLKRIKDIIQAISKSNRDIVFLIIGDGEERNEILSLAGGKCKVIITGFIEEQEELFKRYFCGDCLILASENEVWGLVVNEAMAAGLPIIVSDQCGSSLDLVHNGVNGYIFKTGDVNNLSVVISKMFNESNLGQFGTNSKEIIGKWTFKESRESFERMLNENFR